MSEQNELDSIEEALSPHKFLTTFSFSWEGVDLVEYVCEKCGLTVESTRKHDPSRIHEELANDPRLSTACAPGYSWPP